MGNIIIVAVIVVLCLLALRHFIKSLKTGGCCGGGDVEEKVKVSDKDPSHYPYQETVGISGMSCEHCKQRIENALNREDGVWAVVNLKTNSALVRMKAKRSDDDIKRIITKEGYHVTSIQ